jgi:hypothetical protein
MFHFPVFLPSHGNFLVHNIATVKTQGFMYKLPMEDVLLPNAMIERLYLEGSRLNCWPVGQLSL